ncbi:MAG: hypothetical protein SV487_03835, partial [Thermodesulfobacteriota bacterium]|nr:hypothetical protein [Thermodesulfobacteriota bacterium]
LDDISWYAAVITPEAKDLAGNGLAEAHVIDFATANHELVSGSSGCFISSADCPGGPLSGPVEILYLLLALLGTGLAVLAGKRSG